MNQYLVKVWTEMHVVLVASCYINMKRNSRLISHLPKSFNVGESSWFCCPFVRNTRKPDRDCRQLKSWSNDYLHCQLATFANLQGGICLRPIFTCLINSVSSLSTSMHLPSLNFLLRNLIHQWSVPHLDFVQVTRAVKVLKLFTISIVSINKQKDALNCAGQIMLSGVGIYL